MNTFICLENLRSLYNIGAIFRTCSFYGFYDVILLGYTGKTKDSEGNIIMHPEILKTSLGSEKDLKITMLDGVSELLIFCNENKLDLISIEQTSKSEDIHELIKEKSFNFNNKVVVFGNEATGITTETLENSKYILELPRKGNHNSLNVTTTCGIVLDIINNHSN